MKKEMGRLGKLDVYPWIVPVTNITKITTKGD